MEETSRDEQSESSSVVEDGAEISVSDSMSSSGSSIAPPSYPGIPGIPIEGYLYKKAAGIRTIYEKRWFMLTSEIKLRYFENDMKVRENGVVDVSDVTKLIKIDINYDKSDHPGFSFVSSHRTWKIYADDKDTRDLWFNLLQTVIQCGTYVDGFLNRLIKGVVISLRDEPNRNYPIEHVDYFRSTSHKIFLPRIQYSFYEMAPVIFADIRKMSGFTQDNLLTEWRIPDNKLISSGSSGKSGSIFIISSDYTYMLKSIEKREQQLLQRMIHDYHEHLVKYPDSLLMKVLGFYGIKTTMGRSYFIMFNNLLKITLSIDEKYDLKGSTKDREASKIELQKPVPCLLDNDFNISKRRLNFGPEVKAKFMEHLRADALLLSRFDAMDYSLLIAIHKRKPEDDALFAKMTQPILHDSHFGRRVCTILSADKEEIYFIGIIDIFTFYDTEKKVAHAAKSVSYSVDSLSTINPQDYCKRFCAYTDSIII